MTAPSTDLVQAFRTVLETMNARPGAQMPSREVVANAAHIDPAALSQHTGWHRKWHVRGSRGIDYAVILHMESTADDAPIVDAECTCPAGQSGRVCKHLLRVLAECERDGIPLIHTPTL